jgi:Ca2+-binding EF-hand superfamily protein
LSKHFQFGEVHHEAVGTPYTVAPEVIRGSYDERCDVWAIGVIAFLLFSGDPPFGGCGGPEPLMTVRDNILKGNFAFKPAEVWDLVSDLGKDFVMKMLVTDPKLRPTAREAQKHPWLKQWASRDATNLEDANVLNPNVIKALVNFKEFSQIRKLLSEVLSFTLLPEQIKDLRKEFEKLDTHESGEISLTALKQVLVTNAGAGSLGALTEDEVEDIFNAMRVNKTNTRIHWHEFIAAGLSQCRVDDRNLRLCFDRLDGDHKGYITLDDIINVLGTDDMHSEEELRVMWVESLKSVNCTQRHITYDHFVLLMKGQTKEPEACDIKLNTLHEQQLPSVIEEETDTSVGGSITTTTERYTSSLGVLVSHGLDRSNVEEDSSNFLNQQVDASSIHSLPNLGVNALYGSSSSNVVLSSPPESAERKTVARLDGHEPDKVPDLSPDTDFSEASPMGGNTTVTTIAQPAIVTRRRSKSLENEALDAQNTAKSSSQEVSSGTQSESLRVAGSDTRRALNLPEHGADNIKDELANKSALAVNRQLYRAHRQMRLSILEASRRFEDNLSTRARDTLMKEKVKEAMGAGLVMKHGTKLQVTSDAIRKYLDEARAEQQVLLDKANKRGGRSRKKTVSDMTAIMNPSFGQDEFGAIADKALSQTPDVSKQVFSNSFSALQAMPDLTAPKGAPIGASRSEGLKSKPAGFPGADGGVPHHHKKVAGPKESVVVPPNLPTVDHVDIRKATVPGKFHKTEDPFGSQGMYGGSRLKDEDVNQISIASSKARHPTHKMN